MKNLSIAVVLMAVLALTASANAQWTQYGPCYPTQQQAQNWMYGQGYQRSQVCRPDFSYPQSGCSDYSRPTGMFSWGRYHGFVNSSNCTSWHGPEWNPEPTNQFESNSYGQPIWRLRQGLHQLDSPYYGR
jgi:hypothetical protein